MIHRALVIIPLLALVGCGDTSEARHTPATPWFTEITEAAGIDFVHETGAKGELWLPEIMGGGVAMFDYNNSGRLDIYLVNCNHELPQGTTAESPIDRLYRQEEDGTFTDVTEEAGLGDGGYGMGVAIGDINNNGHIDLFVANYGPDQLYRNNGDGTFTNITEQAGIDVPGWSCSATFLDYNRNGFLDLYITQYVHFDPARRCYDRTGRLAYCSPSAYPPARDVLLRNNGDGTFTDVSEEAGITTVAAAGLGVVVDDFNDNGWQDIYIANDGYANNLWINQGDGTFEDVAVLWGAAYNMHGRPEAGMGVVAADFRNVGQLDLFMTHLTNESNTFYRSRGPGQGFEDVTATVGLATSSLPWTGFGVTMLDTTLNGYMDIIVANGKVVAGERVPGVTLPSPWDEYAEPNLYYRNEGNGRFSLLNGPAAAIAQKLEISRGLAVGDLNNNGMLDVIIANIEGVPRLYRNDAPREGNWLIIRAVDPELRRDAFGARVYVKAGGRQFMRTVNSGYSYLSASDPRVHFGLGRAENIDNVVIRWPDGLRERFDDVQINQAIVLVRGEGATVP